MWRRSRRAIARLAQFRVLRSVSADETETLIAWSEVQSAGGASGCAREALMKARALMERKGATAVVRRIEVLLSEL